MEILEKKAMPLAFRPAVSSDYERLEQLVIESFDPLTWYKKAEERFGRLNGKDWRWRWQRRFRKAFDTETVLVGEVESEIVAFASGKVDPESRLAYLDLIAVDSRYQGRGYGRILLRRMLAHLKEQGAVHCDLECLEHNEAANHLYRSEGFEEVARMIRWFIKIP